ncbi:MAG: extracellular solute-binding protein [Opitutae bacterium]|nr:extracellular solute-binding protein [Opitutae bacterium]
MKTSLTSILLLLSVTALQLAAKPLEIWISSYTDKAYYESMAELYRKEVDKSFEANVTAYGFAEMPDKLMVSIKTRTGGPDIVQLDEVFYGAFLGDKNVPFVDLTKRVKKAGLNKQLHPKRLGVFTWKNKVYALPQSLSAMMLYYRKDMFKENNIKPEDLKTWDDFERVGAELAEKGQRFMAMDPSFFEVVLRQRGSDLFNKEGEFLPDFEIAVETLEWIQKLSKKEIALMPDRGTIFDPVFFSGDVESGEILCVPGADWYGLDLIQQFSPHMKGEWGFMPLPAWVQKGKPGPRTSTFAGQGLLIYKESKAIEKCWDFMEFVITNKDANAKRFLDGNSFPAFLPAFKDKRILKPHDYFTGDKSMGELLVELADEIPDVIPHHRRPNAVFTIRENTFSNVMYEVATPRDALMELKKLIERKR